ncbi:MAG: elongation factor Ts [Dehalococcoidia bacterium]
MPVNAEAVKTVRARTGAGIMDCKTALVDAGGDIEAAVQALEKAGVARGMAIAEKMAGRAASQGLIESYVHQGGRIGVLVELNCETDFVARTDEFKNLAHEIALQVAAMTPKYVGIDDLPEDIDGTLAEVSLWHQPFIRDPSKTVKDLVAEAIGKLGENIRVKRFTRYELGA